jgi:hypothetical protein
VIGGLTHKICATERGKARADDTFNCAMDLHNLSPVPRETAASSSRGARGARAHEAAGPQARPPGPFMCRESLAGERCLWLAIVWATALACRIIGVIVVRPGTRNAGEALGPLAFSFSTRQALALRGRPRLVAVRMGKRARLAGKTTNKYGRQKRATQAN